MIAVDASAVLAIFFEEPEGERCLAVLVENRGLISAVNYWEVLARAHKVHGDEGAREVRGIMDLLALKIAAAEATDADRAYGAFARFGKGQGGSLNLGDCFAYALAEREGDGLLFKGDDFPKTDVMPAI